MLVSAIVAVARNNVIGKDNDIPWYLSTDLKYFKKKTINHHVIMGRKSFRAIGRPLPKRTNIVLSRDPFFIATGCITAHGLEEALNIAHDHGETEVFIIGGAEIYTQSLPYLDKLYYTAVDATPEGDSFFPVIDWDEWQLLRQEDHPAGEKDDHAFSFKVYERKPRAGQ